MYIGAKLRGWQFAAETVQGTPVAANKMIPNGTFRNRRRNNTKAATAEGHRAIVGTQMGKRWSEWSLGGQLGYNIGAYIGDGIFTTATPSSPDTGAYLRAWQDIWNVPHVPKTYSFEYGNTLGSNSKFGFGTMSDFTVRINDTACDYEVGGFAAYPTKNITITTSPTKIPARLVNFIDCRFSYSTSYAGLGAGKLTTGKALELNIRGKYRAVFFVDDATQSIGGILETQQEASGSITVAEGTESDYFLGNLESSTLFYLQLKCTGTLITGSTYHSLVYTWACNVQEEEEVDESDLFAGRYSFRSVEDTTNGDINLSSITTLATL